MAEIPTGFACPDCDKMQVTAMLFCEQFSQKGYYCRNGHEFPDTGDLMAKGPRKLQVPMKKTIQQGYEKVEMEIPADLKNDLLKKFGTPAQLSATLSAVLQALASPRCFIMSDEDIQDIQRYTNEQVTNARAVVGLVNAKVEEIKLLKQGMPQDAGAKNGNGAGNLPEGVVAVNLQPMLAKMAVVLKFRGWTPQQLIEETMKTALDNGWA